MPDWSRRDLLRASGVAAVAVPMSTLVAAAPVAAAEETSRVRMSRSRYRTVDLLCLL